jgi:hypothetical protein
LLVGVSAVNPSGITRPDGLHGIVGILMLSGGDIIEVSRLVAHLVLGPSVSMISGIIRLNPAERIRLGISSLRARKLGLLILAEETCNGCTSSSSPGGIGSVGSRQRARIIVIEAKRLENVGLVLVGIGRIDS